MVVNMKEEIYPNAPIVLMVAEIKHVEHKPLDEKQSRIIYEAVKEILPIRDDGEEPRLTFSAASDGSLSEPQLVQIKVRRYSSRDKRTVVTISPDAISVKTTQYHRYEDVRQLLKQTLTALVDAVALEGVTRIGLRYIDEIRVPSDNDSGMPKWSEWVDESLVGPRDVGIKQGLSPTESEGTLAFSSGDATRLVLRYGAQNSNVIESTPRLRRPTPSPGPLFKLDIDSYWHPENISEFTPDQILAKADLLHAPVRSMFEGLITDRLRNEVLRRG